MSKRGNMATCKSCQQDIIKTGRMEKTTTGSVKYVYYDEKGRSWWGAICPDCHNKKCRKDKQEKSCLVCKKSFSTAKADQVVCSLRCRGIRKVSQAKERRSNKKLPDGISSI
jgi:predicted nucleic acid-binding Zn ribbon protein